MLEYIMWFTACSVTVVHALLYAPRGKLAGALLIKLVDGFNSLCTNDLTKRSMPQAVNQLAYWAACVCLAA